MKNIKLGIVVCGIAGLAACFIGENSLWKAHEYAMGPVLAIIIGFAAAAAMGAMAISKPPMQKWQAIVALVGSVASIWFFQKAGMVAEIFKLTPLIKDHSISSILWSVGFYGGAVFSIIALVKPDDQK